jgi:hypothetical protein
MAESRARAENCGSASRVYGTELSKIEKVGLLMDKKQFSELHSSSVKLMQSYFAAAEKTSGMLNNCAPTPLPFSKRFAILRQEIAEKDARHLYAAAKKLLHDAARLGYEAVQ